MIKIRMRFCGKTRDSKYYDLDKHKDITKGKLIKLSGKNRVSILPLPKKKDDKYYMERFKIKRKFLIEEISKFRKRSR